MRRIVLATFVLGLWVSACGGGNSPTAPTTPTVTTTRIIRLSGNLNFGGVTIGMVRTDGVLIISNDGNAALTVTGLTEPSGMGYTGSWLNGMIAPHASQTVGITFAPKAVQSYSGTITVNGDQTSGVNSIAVTGVGTLDGIPVFSKSGNGDTVFDMPTYITRVRIQADYGGYTSNFIVKIGGSLVVNELIGTGWSKTHFDGTYLTSGGVVAVTNSSGVAWSFNEVR